MRDRTLLGAGIGAGLGLLASAVLGIELAIAAGLIVFVAALAGNWCGVRER